MDPSKARLLDVVIDLFTKERARVLYLTNAFGIADDFWDSPYIQEQLIPFEEIARKGVPDPMRNHPTAEDLRMDTPEMMGMSIPKSQRHQ